MLMTLIYQSKKNPLYSDIITHDFIEKLEVKNNLAEVSGILLYNGDDFFQILEGEESVVNHLYKKIVVDKRHTEVVELMRDYASERYFNKYGIKFHNLTQIKEKNIEVADSLVRNSWFNIARNERVFLFVKYFILRGRSNYILNSLSTLNWSMEADNSRNLTVDDMSGLNENYSFAFQAIVEPLQKKYIHLNHLYVVLRVVLHLFFFLR